MNTNQSAGHISPIDPGPSNLIRQSNLDRLRQVLRILRTATKPQLARQTGLSVVTINALVEALAASGEITAEEPILATGGRPAMTYAYNARFRLALAIHAAENQGRDTVHADVVDLQGAVIDHRESVFDEISEPAIEQVIADMLDRHAAIRAIGIGLPGIETDRGLVVDYAALAGEALIDRLGDRFQMPVVFENDVNAAILGFCSDKPGRGRTVVGIYLPEKYPPGAGICIDGRIHRGRNGFAGEVKYLKGPIDWNRPETIAGSLTAALANLIITFSCVLDPDQIVIYRQNLSESTLAAALAECRRTSPAIRLPEIVASNRFRADYAIGISQIALRALAPHLEASAGQP